MDSRLFGFREEDAQRAFVKFNGRWYAGKQLSCEFSAVQKWQPAICGKFQYAAQSILEDVQCIPYNPIFLLAVLPSSGVLH